MTEMELWVNRYKSVYGTLVDVSAEIIPEWGGDLSAAVRQVAAERDEMLVLLREMWEAWEPDECFKCGRAYRSIWSDGHAPNCHLAAALAKISKW